MLVRRSLMRLECSVDGYPHCRKPDAKTTKEHLMAEEKDELTLYVNMGWPMTLDVGCDPLAPTV